MPADLDLARGLHALGAPPPAHADDPSGRYARGFLRTLHAIGLDQGAVAEEVIGLVALWLDSRVIQPGEADALCDALTAVMLVQMRSRELLGLDGVTADGALHPVAAARVPAIAVTFPNPQVRAWMEEEEGDDVQ